MGCNTLDQTKGGHNEEVLSLVSLENGFLNVY